MSISTESNWRIWFGSSELSFQTAQVQVSNHPFIQPREACIVCVCVCVFKGGILANDEVEKALLRLAVKFHPDKVRDRGAEYQKQAEAVSWTC